MNDRKDKNLCPYCQSINLDLAPNCQMCGGPLGIAQETKNEREHEQPFAYNGYIVWPLIDYARKMYAFYFYLGIELQGVVEISDFSMRQLVPEGNEYMPLIWEMFLTARGEQPVVIWNVEPFQYTITQARATDEWYAYAQLVEVQDE